jgi:hypothetical protein
MLLGEIDGSTLNDRPQNGATLPGPRLTMESSGFNLGSVLLFGSGLFVLATLFFGTKGGYYDSDDYDGNGTAH